MRRKSQLEVKFTYRGVEYPSHEEFLKEVRKMCRGCEDGKPCPYYYGEIDECMLGEDENLCDEGIRKCKESDFGR